MLQVKIKTVSQYTLHLYFINPNRVVLYLHISIIDDFAEYR